MGLMIFAPIQFSAADQKEYSNHLLSELKASKGEMGVTTDDPEYIQAMKQSSKFGNEQYYKYADWTAIFVAIGIFTLSLVSPQVTFVVCSIMLLPLIIFSMASFSDGVFYWLLIAFGLSGELLKRRVFGFHN